MNIVERILADKDQQPFRDHIAITTGQTTLRYRELRQQVAEASARLRKAEIQPGDSIVLLGRDTPELVVHFLATLAVGAIGILVSSRFGNAELAIVVAENHPRLILHDAGARQSILASPALSTIPRTRLIATAHENLPQASPLEILSRDPYDPAFCLYSSGTTGNVKGIRHGHKDFSAALMYHREVLELGPGCRTFCTSKLAFAYAMVTGLLAPLALGATLCLAPDWLRLADVCRLLKRFHPQVVYSTPSLLRALLNALETDRELLSQVRHYTSAGEHLAADLLEHWIQTTGRRIHDCYGCSEAPFFILAVTTADTPPGSAGVPAPGAQLRLLDSAGTPVAKGETGRLWIQHDFLASGYPGDPQAWSTRMNNGWFDTGDLFRQDPEGYWYHCGREDSLTKVAGQWVSLPEIEETCVNSHLVAEAAAVLHPDQDGLRRIALLVVVNPTQDTVGLEPVLQQFLAQHLARWKRPKWILPVAALPRTHTGKIQRYRLKTLVEEQLSAVPVQNIPARLGK